MGWKLGCAHCRTSIPEGRAGRYCSAKCEERAAALAGRQRWFEANRQMVKACTEWIAAEVRILETYHRFLEERGIA